MARTQGHGNSWHRERKRNNWMIFLMHTINGQLCAVNVMERNWQLLLLLLCDDHYVVKLPNILTKKKLWWMVLKDGKWHFFSLYTTIRNMKNFRRIYQVLCIIIRNNYATWKHELLREWDEDVDRKWREKK